MKKLILLVLLGFFMTSNAQDFKFGKVSKAELEEKEHPLDKEAHAAVLYKSHKTYYDYNDEDGFVQKTKVVERIKIYDKDGFDWATKEIQLYDKNNKSKESFREFSGYTFTLENGKVKKTKIKKESIFGEKNNKFWATKKFVMPNIKEGCVIEYKYIISSPFITIKDIDLQYSIPIKKLDVLVKIPEYFIFKKFTNPKAFYIPKLIDNIRQRTENMVSRSKASSNNGLGVTSGKVSSSQWSFAEKETKVNETNIPALKSEPFVKSIDLYRAKITWEYAAYKGVDNAYKNYSTTWEEVAKTISNSSSFGDELKKNKYFKEDIDALIADISEPKDKAFKIYNFVKSKMKHNDFIGFYTNDGVKSAYKEGVGNLAEINLMLTAMLRYAGLKANPVILSTRSNGIPLFPSTEGFNYVISAIEHENGKITLLDATNANSTANILPEYAINWQGRVLRENGSSDWISLNPKNVSNELVMLNYTFNSELELEGKIRKRLTDYLALNYRDNNNGDTNETRISKLEEGKGDIEILNVEVKDEKQLNRPIAYNYDFKLKNSIDEIDQKLYLSPLLFLNSQENPFTQEERVYPIDFIYPTLSKYIVKIELPEGYTVESRPENTKVKLNNNQGEFSYLSNSVGNSLQLTVVFKLNKTYVIPSEYKEFKEFFALAFEKQSEQIVLVKK